MSPEAKSEAVGTGWHLRGSALRLDPSPLIAAVVNATPDSFSDDHLDRSPGAVLERVGDALEAGAAIVEVGGESNVSNRPAVPAAEEIERVLPVVEAAVRAGAVVSIDTYKPEVARAALDAGAAIVNDISGLSDPAMVQLCAETGAGVVLMHTITPPKVSRWDDDAYPGGVVEDVRAWFEAGIARLAEAGVGEGSVVLDPGIDFAKTPAQSVELLRGFARLAELGLPLMSALSRKDFIGAITGRRPTERLAGTLAAVAWAVANGARVIRAHDVAETRDYLAVASVLSGEMEVSPSLRLDERVRREPPSPLS